MLPFWFEIILKSHLRLCWTKYFMRRAHLSTQERGLPLTGFFLSFYKQWIKKRFTWHYNGKKRYAHYSCSTFVRIRTRGHIYVDKSTENLLTLIDTLFECKIFFFLFVFGKQRILCWHFSTDWCTDIHWRDLWQTQRKKERKKQYIRVGGWVSLHVGVCFYAFVAKRKIRSANRIRHHLHLLCMSLPLFFFGFLSFLLLLLLFLFFVLSLSLRRTLCIVWFIPHQAYIPR